VRFLETLGTNLMLIQIDLEKCTGCSLCVFCCAEKVITCWGIAKIDKEKCTNCMQCAKFCPVSAIKEGS